MLAPNLIDDFGQTITVNRDDQPQSVINGHIVPGKPTQLQITACVQPLKGQEILMFAEADRVRQSVKIYTYDQLKILNEVTKTKADIVVYNDTLFEVVSVEKWESDGFTYYKSIGRRIDR